MKTCRVLPITVLALAGGCWLSTARALAKQDGTVQQENTSGEMRSLPFKRQGNLRFFEFDSDGGRGVKEEDATLRLARSLDHPGVVSRVWIDGGHARSRLRCYLDKSPAPHLSERIGIAFEEGRSQLSQALAFANEKAAGARVAYPGFRYRQGALLTITSAPTACEVELYEDEAVQNLTVPKTEDVNKFSLPMVSIEPGATSTLGSDNSGGTIVSLTLMPADFGKCEFDKLILLASFDGEAKPSIEASLQSIFSVAANANPISGLPAEITPTGLKLQLPAPYRSSAVVQIRNAGSAAVQMRGEAVISRTPVDPSVRKLRIAEWSGELSEGAPAQILNREGAGHFVGFTMAARGRPAPKSHLEIACNGRVLYRSISLASTFDGGSEFGAKPFGTPGGGLTAVNGDTFFAYHFRTTRPAVFTKKLDVAFKGAGPAVAVGGAAFWYEEAPQLPKPAAGGAAADSTKK